MKHITITTMAALLFGASGLYAQNEATTKPSGFVTHTVKGADGGTPQLSALTVALRSPDAASGSISAFGGLQAAGAGLPSRQELTISDAAWSVDQWTGNSHLVYIEKDDGSADGAEQAFLIISHTADTLTVATDFDLSGRFAVSDRAKITASPTFGSVFGTDGGGLGTNVNPNTADNIYVWTGGAWSQYYHNGTNWSRLTPFLANANDAIIYPDEGVFVLRKVAGDVDLVLTGAVPVKNQISDVPSGFTFVSTQYPVGTKLIDMGFQNLTGWVSNVNPNAADSLFNWDTASQSWQQYYHNGSNWVRLSPFTANADELIIAGGSPMFVSRASGGAGDSGNTHTLPYDLTP